MAVYDLEEQEQLDAIKAWWKRWGNTVFAAVGVFVITYAGIQGWRTYKASRAGAAATMYEAVEKEKDPKKAAGAAKAIIDKYGDTAYAARAALLAAKTAFEAGDLATARTNLEWVANQAAEKELRDVARLRLAGVLADEKKFDEALRVLEASQLPEFAAATLSMKGDVLVAQGKRTEARAAYRSALEKAGPAADKQSIETKLDMLGEGK
jgi:predicted negative regulator of RcsB-dependent stress response